MQFFGAIALLKNMTLSHEQTNCYHGNRSLAFPLQDVPTYLICMFGLARKYGVESISHPRILSYPSKTKFGEITDLSK